MRFLDFIKTINEDIKTGPRNEEIWLDYLNDKYSEKTNQNIFITFVSVDKVGINPRSPYDTPIGVYAYPLEYVLEREDVPFRGEANRKSNKIKILKSNSKKVLSNDLSDDEYDDKIEILEKKYKVSISDIMVWEKHSRKKTLFGKLWNVTRNIALKFSKNKPEKKIETDDDLYDELTGKNSEAKNSSVLWNKILQEIGYEYVLDNGDGVIHPNEPTQAVFLKNSSYKVIDEHWVDTESKFEGTQSKETKELLKRIKSGWNRSLIEDVLKNKQYRYLKIFDETTLGPNRDALMSVIGVDFELFKKLFKYFLKDGKLENFEMYFNKAINMFHPSKENSENILNFFIDLEDPRMYNKRFDSNRFISYLRHVYNGKNKEQILEKFLKTFGKEL